MPKNEGKRMQPSIIIPAFNEGGTIQTLIDAIRAVHPQAQIVIADDGSQDFGGEGVTAAGVHLIHHPYNIGNGAAVKTGIRNATGDVLIFMDADGQHRPASVGSLIEAMRELGADVVIGSRFLQGSYRMGVARKIGSRIFSHIARAYTGVRITDPTSGFQLLNREAFAYLAEGDNYPLDYPDVNIIMALHKKNFRIAEAPVAMTENSTGKSMHDGLRPLYYVVKMFLAIVMVLMKRKGR